MKFDKLAVTIHGTRYSLPRDIAQERLAAARTIPDGQLTEDWDGNLLNCVYPGVFKVVWQPPMSLRK